MDGGYPGYSGTTCSIPVWLFAVIIILFIFFSVVWLCYKNYQTNIKKEIDRSDAERSLLQDEITLMSEGRRIDDRDLEWIPPIIAEGTFGEVWKGVWDMLPNQYVAIKKIKSNKAQLAMHASKVNEAAPLTSFESSDGYLLINPDRRDSGLEDVDPLFSDIGGSSSNSGNGEEDEDGRKELKLLMRLKPHARTVLFHGAGRLRATGEIFLVSEFMDNGDLYGE